jgi:hypothetical protein
MKTRIRASKSLNRCIKPIAAAAVLLLLIFSTDTRADRSLRCNGAIVSLGATRLQVLDKCGPPVHRERREISRDQYMRQFYDYKNERFILPKMTLGPIQMERWTYNFGSNQFIRYLYFRNDDLIKIETGDKGSD